MLNGRYAARVTAEDRAAAHDPALAVAGLVDRRQRELGARLEHAVKAHRVAVANQPEADDQVVESSGAKVFLDPQAAVALDDKVLDASAQPDGRVDFAIGQQG